MAIRDLAAWLIQQPAFLAALDELTVLSVRRQFPSLAAKQNSPNAQGATSPDWTRLLLSASLLAESTDGACQDAALRIAQSCIEDRTLNERRYDVAAAILDQLANRVAIGLAEKRHSVVPGVEERLPLPMRLQWSRHTIENSVDDGASQVNLNRFQKRFWNAIERTPHVSASAPTATGKSFVMMLWLSSFIRENMLSNVATSPRF